MAKLQVSKIGQTLSFQLIKGTLNLVGLLSMKWLYRISDAINWLFLTIIKYRKKIVYQNLDIAFPNLPQKEKQNIVKGFYQNLSDILLESIKGFWLNKEELLQRFKYTNPEVFNPYYEKNQSVILIGSHYGNWEWGVLSVQLWLKHQVVGIYKPINHQKVDQYINGLRKKWGLQLASMGKIARTLVLNKDIPCAYVFIADQSPSDVVNAHWINFFDRETAFLHGVDKIARRTGFPVFLFNIKRVKRGYYEVTFELLCSNPKETKEGAITQQFATSLENYIREYPGDWLWSHHRWKRTKPSLTSL